MFSRIFSKENKPTQLLNGFGIFVVAVLFLKKAGSVGRTLKWYFERQSFALLHPA